MSDVFSKAKRSEVMSRIRGRGNKNTATVTAPKARTGRGPGGHRVGALAQETRSRPAPLRPHLRHLPPQKLRLVQSLLSQPTAPQFLHL